MVYDQLSQALRPLNVTPLFRLEENRQVILLMNGIIQPKPTKIWGNILFFVLTLLSVMFVGGANSATTTPTTFDGWVNFYWVDCLLPSHYWLSWFVMSLDTTLLVATIRRLSPCHFLFPSPSVILEPWVLSSSSRNLPRIGASCWISGLLDLWPG